MKSIIDFNSENNVYVESKLYKSLKAYYEKIKSIQNTDSNDDAQYIPEGTKVKLNYDSLVNEPNYKKKSKAYKKFIKTNKDKIMTVEYTSKYKDKPVFVCLKEDEGKVKWLWHYEFDLIVVDSN